jgi:hypothetical protein
VDTCPKTEYPLSYGTEGAKPRLLLPGPNITQTVFIECGSMYRADGPVKMKPVGETKFVNGNAAMDAEVRNGLAGGGRDSKPWSPSKMATVSRPPLVASARVPIL